MAKQPLITKKELQHVPTSSSKFHDKARTNEIMTIIMVAAARAAAASTASLSASDIRYWNVLTRTYGRQIYTSYIRLTFWQRKKEKLKIVSIYVPLSGDEG